jgi:hypothetical protein
VPSSFLPLAKLVPKLPSPPSARPARGWFSWSTFESLPGWVHGLLLAVLLLFDGLMYYFQVLNPAAHIRMGLVWLVRNAALDGLTAFLFYWNWLVLIPRTLARNRLGWYVAEASASILVFAVLRLGLNNLIYAELAHFTPQFQAGKLAEAAAALTLPSVGIVLLSSSLRITLDYLHGQRLRQELEGQRLRTELAMLKTQLNPHFLFNTLNNLYSLTSRKSDRAPEAVLRLAESMRYLLYESTAPTVPVSQEVRHLRSLLELQRLRLPVTEAETALVLHVRGAVETAFPVAPLLLLPLVENAFKHGDLAARPEAVRLELDLSVTELRFSVHNYLAPASAELPSQAGGLGLANLRRRLELLYPGAHSLVVRTLPGEYAVELVLQRPGDGE